MPKPARNRHRQNEVLLQVPELEPGQFVARVIQACGENNYEVETEHGRTCLYHLPKRLRFVTFVKRGSFVFVRDDDTRGPGKVRGDIETVILDAHLSTLRRELFWPLRFSKDSSSHNFSEPQRCQQHCLQLADDPDSDSFVDSFWETGTGNPNRPPEDNSNIEVDSSEAENEV